MSKKRSIKDTITAVAEREAAAREAAAGAAAPRNDVITSSGYSAETLKRHDVDNLIPASSQGKPIEVPSGKRPHTSFYASEAVLKTIRVLAAEDGVRPQEIFRRAMKAYFETRGKDFDALDKT